MKFDCKVHINRPLSEVIELFMNPDNMSKWQDGFISFQHQQGVPGKIGATAIIKYKRAELLETITHSDLPQAYHGTYEGSWGKNTMENYFTEINNQTTWESKIDYIEMNGLMMKIMGKLMPGIFRKQTQKFMDNFKSFVET